MSAPSNTIWGRIVAILCYCEYQMRWWSAALIDVWLPLVDFNIMQIEPQWSEYSIQSGGNMGRDYNEFVITLQAIVENGF